MFEQLFELPTLREFTQRIADALVTEHHSVVVVLPALMTVDAITARIYRESLHRGPKLRCVIVRDSTDPLKVIAESEGVQYQGKLTVEKLLSQIEKVSPEDRSAILHITGLEDASPKTQQAWLELFTHWAEVAQTRSAGRLVTPALLLILDANRFLQDLPSSNVFLQVFWFRQLSRLEMQLLCRLQPDPGTDEPLTIWREQVLPDLVGADLNLLEWLWEPVARMRSVDNLMVDLRKYAKNQGWEEAVDSESATQIPPTTHVDHLNASQRNLWARGLLYYTPENGWEMHSAVLALMNKQTEVSHRYWRGQARLMLPFVDHIRHSILTRLTIRHGDGWPSRLVNPAHNPELDAPIQDASQVEWGHLMYLIEHSEHTNGEWKWHELIRLGWNIRNRIAHYEPITLSDYRALRQEFERFTEERM